MSRALSFGAALLSVSILLHTGAGRAGAAEVVVAAVPAAAVQAVGAAAATGARVLIGQESAPLDGPWKFHLGDHPAWAAPDFDDSRWETVDLTPPPGARDNDVGLPGYVPGWQARGHAGYYGYAWYRLHLDVTAPAGEDLAIAGPFAVDSAYQLYANGRLLGAVGDFSGAVPAARSNHRPALFILPPEMRAGSRIVVAIRVWLGLWPRAPDEGGIHIAPLIGTVRAITDRYRLQWLTLFEGYVVDGVEGSLLLLLALMALSVGIFDRGDRAYPWIAAACLFLGIHRGNQAVMFLGNFETMHEFEIFILVLAVPLYTGSWVMAWRSWLRLREPGWVPKAIVMLTLGYILAVFVCRSWFRGVFPDFIFTAAPRVIAILRWGLLLLYAFTAYQGARRKGREGWYACVLMVVLAAGIFGGELHYFGTPGIWFPFGVGLSLSECAYAAFVPLMAALLLRRLGPTRQQSAVHGRPSPLPVR